MAETFRLGIYSNPTQDSSHQIIVWAVLIAMSTSWAIDDDFLILNDKHMSNEVGVDC